MAEEVVDDSADSVAQLIKDAEEISDVGDASEGHFFVGRYIPTDRTEARRRHNNQQIAELNARLIAREIQYQVGDSLDYLIEHRSIPPNVDGKRLVPLLDMCGGKPIPGFPATTGELRQMSADAMDRIIHPHLLHASVVHCAMGYKKGFLWKS